MAEDKFVRDWTRVVRRARLGRTVKSVAIALATYADPDGTRVYPGVARLTYECELSYTTIKAALRTLRSAGLITKVGQRGDADEYNLTFHEDLFERLDIPSPSAAELEIEKIRKAWKGNYSPNLRSTRPTAEIDGDDDLRSTRPTAETLDPEESAVNGSTTQTESAVNGSPNLRSTPPPATYQDVPHKNTLHSDEDLSTDITVPSDPMPNEDPISPPADLASRPRCPHGRTTRHDKDGPRCVDCRTEAERITAEAVKIQLGPSKCDAHKLPIAKCNFCRRGLPGAEA